MNSFKEILQPKHEELDTMLFYRYLQSGEATLEDCSKYIYQMIQIYQALEDTASKFNLLDNLPSLPRYLLAKHNYESLVGENIKHVILPATHEYCNYIKESNDYNRVLAHMYVRYGEDLTGGQITKTKLTQPCTYLDFDYINDTLEVLSNKVSVDVLDEVVMGYNYTIAIYRQLQETKIFV